MMERPVVFDCRGRPLLGIIHFPEPDTAERLGLLIVVGGPQYRVGSHRLFVRLARALAADGIPVFRFDCRGMGDSGGEHPGFEGMSPDIDAAIAAFMAAVPELDGVVLWGLCDAASAMCLYPDEARRVRGAILVNPWVREGTSYEDVLVRHYYARRVREAEFWRRLILLRIRWREFFGFLRRRIRRRASAVLGTHGSDSAGSLVRRMGAALAGSDRRVLVILSQDDLTAREFDEASGRDPAWRKLFSEPRVRRLEIAGADHTFSDPGRATRMINACRAWFTAHPEDAGPS